MNPSKWMKFSQMVVFLVSAMWLGSTIEHLLFPAGNIIVYALVVAGTWQLVETSFSFLQERNIFSRAGNYLSKKWLMLKLSVNNLIKQKF